jgi:primosomal protein N' (replication factor Y)
MAELFEQPVEDSSRAPAAQAGRRVGVVVNANLWQTFDYLWPEQMGEPTLGQRMHVPFGRGNRRNLAFVVEVNRTGDAGGHALKVVSDVIDQQSHFDPTLWKLAQWMSHYYMTPLGMVLAAMIPSAVGRHAARNETVAFLTSHHNEWPASLGVRQRKVLDELYEARKQGIEPLTMEALVAHSGGGRETVQRLAARNLIRLQTRAVQLPVLSDADAKAPFELNDDQEKVMRELEGNSGFSVTLLHGVTGSGKTEIYVRAIQRVIAQGM